MEEDEPVQKPASEKEIIDTLWFVIIGSDRDSISYKLDKMTRLIDEFIANKDSLRANTCPYVVEFERLRISITKHLESHEHTKNDKSKSISMILVIIGISLNVLLSVLSFFIK